MSPVRFVVALIVVLAAACSDDPASSTTTATPVTTIGTSTTGPTTTTSAVGATTGRPDNTGQPTYLVYGWDGVTRYAGTTATVLITEPVQWAVDDGAGGVVFRSVADEPGIGWLAAGADRPVRVDLDGRTGVLLVAALDGRPSLVVTRSRDDMAQCTAAAFVQEIAVVDLATGDGRVMMCREQASDVDDAFSSYGGGRFAVARVVYAGASSTTTTVEFIDAAGRDITVAHNPFTESCAPCRLTVHLSPDGSRLAYALWPAAFWGEPEPADGDYQRAIDEWWEAHRAIPTRIGVVDLATGEQIWREETAADAAVDEFDGRFAITSSTAGRLIHDTLIGESREIPQARTEPTAFWTAIVGSYPVSEASYDDVQRRAAARAAAESLPTGVLWSSGYPTLRPGYWAVFTGHFATRAEAAARCDDLLDPAEGCYSRYVATADTIDPAIGRSLIELSGDGLGIARFGDDVDDVMATLTRVLGPPAWDAIPYPGESIFPGEFFRTVGWENPNLQIHFFDWDGDRVVDRPILGYWGTVDDSGALATAEGMTVGDRFAELAADHGDRLSVFAPDECTSEWQFAIDRETADGPFFIRGSLDGSPDGAATRITGMRAGIEMGPC